MDAETIHLKVFDTYGNLDQIVKVPTSVAPATWQVSEFIDHVEKEIFKNDIKVKNLRYISDCLKPSNDIVPILVGGSSNFAVDTNIEHEFNDADFNFDTKIIVKSLCKPNKNMMVDLNMPALCLALKVQELFGMSLKHFRLVRNGKVIVGNKKTLAEYGIEAGNTFHVVLNLRGGGGGSVMAFANVANESAVKNIELAKTGPRHLVVCSGYNIHGICSNECCSLYGREFIRPQGIGVFPLVEFIECHGCGQQSKTTTCGFIGCEYEIEGIQEDGTRYCSGKKSAGKDSYLRFNDTDNKVGWLKLVVRTAMDQGGMSHCSICLHDSFNEHADCQEFFNVYLGQNLPEI